MDEMTLSRMREMKLTQMAHRLSEMRDDPKCHDLHWKDAVASLVDTEYDHRSSRRLQELLRKAHLKYPAANPQSQSRCRLLPTESRGKEAASPCENHIPVGMRSCTA